MDLMLKSLGPGQYPDWEYINASCNNSIHWCTAYAALTNCIIQILDVQVSVILIGEKSHYNVKDNAHKYTRARARAHTHTKAAYTHARKAAVTLLHRR